MTRVASTRSCVGRLGLRRLSQLTGDSRGHDRGPATGQLFRALAAATASSTAAASVPIALMTPR